MSRIFLGHETSTAAEAAQLSVELGKHGATIWLESGELEAAGKDWIERIEKALDEADAYVILVRAGEEPSEQLRAEWRKAAKHAARRPGKKLVPVVVGGAQPPPFLRVWNAVPMTNDIEETSQRVLQVLEEPGANEAPADSPVIQPLVEDWRRRLQIVEKTAVAFSEDSQDIESVG